MIGTGKKCTDIIPHSFYDSFSVIRGESWNVKGVGLKERGREGRSDIDVEMERLNGKRMVTSLRR